MAEVVDTNVPLVVKRAHEWPQPLVDACDELLATIMEGRSPVVIDLHEEILEEYLNQLSLSGAPTLGDVFAKWVYDHRWTWDASLRPDLGPRGDGVYDALGGDHDEIDPSDRKFVAAAKLTGCPIHQATDTKWLDWSGVLSRHGVEVRYVDEPAIRAAYRAKFETDPP